MLVSNATTTCYLNTIGNISIQSWEWQIGIVMNGLYFSYPVSQLSIVNLVSIQCDHFSAVLHNLYFSSPHQTGPGQSILRQWKECDRTSQWRGSIVERRWKFSSRNEYFKHKILCHKHPTPLVHYAHENHDFKATESVNSLKNNAF